MRFSLFTLLVGVLLAASAMTFVRRFPVWRFQRELTVSMVSMLQFYKLKKVRLADDS